MLWVLVNLLGELFLVLPPDRLFGLDLSGAIQSFPSLHRSKKASLVFKGIRIAGAFLLYIANNVDLIQPTASSLLENSSSGVDLFILESDTAATYFWSVTRLRRYSG